MYITEIHTVVEDGDAFFPEFDAGDFDVIIVETLGEKIKNTRTVYRRKNKGLWQFYLISAVKERGQYTQKPF